MALTTSNFSVNFVKGVDTKLDPKISEGMLLAQNVSFEKEGTPRKRNGYDLISSDFVNPSTVGVASLQDGYLLSSYNRKLVQRESYRFNTYNESLDAWTNVNKAPLSTLDVERLIGSQTNQQIGCLSFCYTNNFLVICARINWVKDQIFIFDKNTLNLVDTYIPTSTTESCMVYSLNNVIFFVQTVSVNTIQVYSLTFVSNTLTATLTASFGVPILANKIDVITDTAGTFAYVAYTQAPNLLAVAKINTNGTLNSSASVAISTTVNNVPSLTILDSGNIYATCCFNNGAINELYGVQFNTSLGIVTNSLIVSLSSDKPDYCSVAIGTNATTFLNAPASAFQFGTYFVEYVIGVAAGAPTLLCLESVLASKAWIFEGVPTVYISRMRIISAGVYDFINGAYHAIDTNFITHSRLLVGRNYFYNFGVDTLQLNTLPLPIFVGNDLICPLAEVSITDTAERSFDGNYTIDLVNNTYRSVEQSQSISIANTLYLAGAMPLSFDGQQIYETGFNHGPHAEISSTGAGTLTGVYQYVFIYEFYNSQGLAVVSFPSNVITVELSSQQVSFVVSNYKIGYLASQLQCRIKGYKTDADGSVFFLFSDTANNYLSVQQTITDNSATNTNAATYYFPGDILESSTASPFNSFTVYKNRIFAVIADQPNVIQYTKEKDFKLEPGFNEFLRVFIQDTPTENNEQLTCVASLDDKLIIFKSSSTFYLYGDGPDNEGTGSGFSPAQLLSYDVGCENPRSIVLTPAGLMFQSKKGIFVVNRGMELKYIGAPVEKYLSTISNAILNEEKNEVVFSTFDSNALVYNYFFDQWSIFDNYDCNSMTFWLNKIIRCLPDGEIRRETPGVYIDGTDFIEQRLVTNWIKAKDIQDYGRFLRLLVLGDYKSTHIMKIDIAYDYQNYFTDEYSLIPRASDDYNITEKPTDAVINSGGSDGIYQWEIHLKTQKCEAIKISILDEQDGDAGESYHLTNMTVKVGLKKGPYKTPIYKRG